MKRVFFYGLFMDEGLLKEKGLHPKAIGPARLIDYRIRIVDRATLIRAPGFESYGMVMELSDSDLRDLYASPGVSDYLPETVDAVLLKDGSIHRSICYNLPTHGLGTVANVQYAQALSRLLLQLGFPEDYAREIRDQRDD